MSGHDAGSLFNLLIVGIVVLVTIVSRLRGMRGRVGTRQAAAAQQQGAAQQVAAARQTATAQQSAAQQTAAAQPRVTKRVIQPAKGSADVPVLLIPVAAEPPLPARRMLTEAFGDPAHARGAVILAEVLGPPVALR